MNIQLSVILWTVICFSLLMVILNNLLFRPVLKVLDERKRKLNEAREKKETCSQLHQEQTRLLEEMQAEHDRRKKAVVQAAIEQIQLEEKTLLKDAHRDCLQRIDAYRVHREKELEEILTAVSPRMARVSDLFVQQIVSDRD